MAAARVGLRHRGALHVFAAHRTIRGTLRSMRRFLRLGSCTVLIAMMASWSGQATAQGAPAAPRKDDPFAFFGEIGRVLAVTERLYVEPVERKRLLEGALRGMVEKLDPHSAWLDAKEYRELVEETEGKFGGVGIEVDLRGDVLTVVAPIEGGPAERAGIKSGERILAVDGQSVEMVGLEKMVSRLRGEPGTSVTLLIAPAKPKEPKEKELSKDEPKPAPATTVVVKPRTVQLRREIIHVPSVSKKALAEGVGYIRLKQFQEGTHLEFLRALASLRNEAKQAGRPGPRALLLDLRSNPGGLVDEAVAIADEFLDDGVILTMRARGRITETIVASRGGAAIKLPVVLVMNEWSASAAELFAGALQDPKRAAVVGVDSFGKGVVQTILELPGGTALKLTTARYYTPNGHAVQADGIHPDRVAVATPADPSDVYPIVRERDLPNAMSGDGKQNPVQAPREGYSGQPGEYAVARDVPEDPRKGDDGMLRIAFEELLRRAK